MTRLKTLFYRGAFLALLCISGFCYGANVPSRTFYICDKSSEECNGVTNEVRPAANYSYPDGGPLRATDFDVKYILFTPRGEEIAFHFDNMRRITSKFEPNAEWKVLIHGFFSSQSTDFPVNVQKAYIEHMNKTGRPLYNILVVDWSKGACGVLSSKFYETAAQNTEAAGVKLGNILQRLNLQYKVPFNQMHLIGHSLGSHVAGNAARRVFDITGKRLWRITALDPAGPLFWRNILMQIHQPYPRLRRNRVSFLDVYHTSEMFGGEQEMGDVDVYVNGGRRQPICDKTFLSYKIEIPEIFNQVCSHSFATTFFAQTINDKNIKGCTGCYNYIEFQDKTLCKCEEEPVLGEFITEDALENKYPYASGRVYVDTKVESHWMKDLFAIYNSSGFIQNLQEVAKGYLKGLCFMN